MAVQRASQFTFNQNFIIKQVNFNLSVIPLKFHWLLYFQDVMRTI